MSVVPGSLDDALEVFEAYLRRQGLKMTEQRRTMLRAALDHAGHFTADDVHETLVAAQRAMNVVAQLGSGPLVTSATRALSRLASAAEKLDSTLASEDLSRSVRQLDEITESLNDMVVGLSGATQALARIMEKIDSDSGTFGRLVNDTTMYNEVVRLTTSMRLLLDDKQPAARAPEPNPTSAESKTTHS